MVRHYTSITRQNIFSPLQSEIISKNRKILEVFTQNKLREVNNELIVRATRETITQVLTRIELKAGLRN